MGLSEHLENMLDLARITFPITASELLTTMHDFDADKELIDILSKMDPDFVFEDKRHIINLFEDPGALEV